MTRAVDPRELGVRVDGGIAEVVVDRPRLNILDLPILHVLDGVLAGIEKRSDWRVLTIRGTPSVFSAGVAVEDHVPERIADTLTAFRSVLERLEALDRPTIAVVRGPCLGGGMELAMACDIVAAADSATFGQPEIRLAAIPPYAIARYEGLVGRRRAFHDLATGRTFPASEAMAAGYLTACLPEAELDPWVARIAATLAAGSPAAIAVLKRTLRGNRATDDLARVEERYLRELSRSPDAAEGIRAFLEKRPPRWEGVR